MKPRLLAPLLIFLCLVAAPAVAHEWDQEEVSATTGRLMVALRALLSDPEIDAKQSTAVRQREHEAAIATSRQVLDLLPGYKKRIDEGYTREESRPFWDQIDLLRGDIQAYARQSWLPPATDKKADRVIELFDQLAHYYSRRP